MAQEIYDGLQDEDFFIILNIKCRDEMIQFHHSTGRWVRNKFKLWERGYTPVIENGVDVAEDHPDAISMRVLKLVWDKVHKKTSPPR